LYRQEKPAWCPHQDCIFTRRVLNALCGGRLPEPEPHDGDLNLHRICIRTDTTFDLKVNDSDLDWLRWIFDSLDGKATSNLSKQ